MKYKDLSEYVSNKKDYSATKTLCVGWLNHVSDFSVGDTPSFVLDKVYESIKNNTIEQMRSCSPCLLCFPSMDIIREATLSGDGTDVFAFHSNLDAEPILLGGRVVLHKGFDKNYIYPDLIWHYIKEHRYLPPQEFISAIVNHD